MEFKEAEDGKASKYKSIHDIVNLIAHTNEKSGHKR